MLLCRTVAIALQISQNLGCCLFTPLRSHMSLASVKSRYALPPHKATIVLPAFARSCSTDEGIKKEKISIMSLRAIARQPRRMFFTIQAECLIDLNHLSPQIKRA
jgi:hypothetical protein